MIDLRTTIAPKSDQLNADDLIGQSRTIKVTQVSRCAEPDQPIAINYDGDDGKPYKPGKSMRRVLVQVWGPDGNAYVGRSMTIYRDEKVQFGGLAVGGIRISHMSHIKKDVTMALTATRANKKPFTVKPLIEIEEEPAIDLDALFKQGKTAAWDGMAHYQAFWKGLTKLQQQGLLPKHPELKAIAQQADEEAAKQAAEKSSEDDGFGFSEPTESTTEEIA